MKNNLPIKSRLLYKRLLSYVKPFWPVLLLGVLANILYSGIDAGFTYMTKLFWIKALLLLIWILLNKSR